jgi:CRP/FNR family transcriptional regulator
MYVTMRASNPQAVATPERVFETRRAVQTSLKAGQYLYFEGDEVEHLYHVVSGVVRLTRLLEDGRRQVISFGFPGDIIGFPAGGCHHTDCDALVESTLKAFRRSALDNGDGDPELHAALLRAALNEISEMQDHVMMLGRKSASEKVASFLLVMMQRFGQDRGGCRQITLPMTRADIADFLGLTPETVCRSFTALRKDGIIALDGVQTVILRDPVRLERLSEGDA